MRRGQEGVGLLAHDGHEIVDRAGAVLALEGRVVTEVAGDVLGLVDHPRADGPGIDLDEADDVGLLSADEFSDAGENLAIAAQVARTRQGQMERGPGASGIPDVIDEQTQGGGLRRKGRHSIGDGESAGGQKSPAGLPDLAWPYGLRGVAGRRRTPEFRGAHACARLTPMSQANPIRLFVTHVWEDNDDYLRVFEYLESAKNFFYKNYSTPDHPPAGDKEAQREDLRRQIAPVEAVIAIPSLLLTHKDMFTFELLFAQASQKPVILMKPFGSHANHPKTITDLADEIADWDERALVDAIRRQARHEETTRWDTIEFKLD